MEHQSAVIFLDIYSQLTAPSPAAVLDDRSVGHPLCLKLIGNAFFFNIKSLMDLESVLHDHMLRGIFTLSPIFPFGA
jgi:hypothetical protein